VCRSSVSSQGICFTVCHAEHVLTVAKLKGQRVGHVPTSPKGLASFSLPHLGKVKALGKHGLRRGPWTTAISTWKPVLRCG